MSAGDIIFQQTNFAASMILLCYLVFFITFSSVTTFMTLGVYKNVEKFRTVKRFNRRAFFVIYMVLNLSNVPFGAFMATVFAKLGSFSAMNSGPVYESYPLYDLAKIAILTGMASHILFVAFWVLAWMHVESGIAEGS